MLNRRSSNSALSELCQHLLQLPPPERFRVVTQLLEFSPSASLEQSFNAGQLRALLANCWEQEFEEPVPIRRLRDVVAMIPRLDMKERLLPLLEVHDEPGFRIAFLQLLRSFRICCSPDMQQQRLFAEPVPRHKLPSIPQSFRPHVPTSVRDLSELVAAGKQFATIYADPPWRYDNVASRGAAMNHYRTMTLDEICAEPVRQLAADRAHLHLWTTNAFLPAAFRVIEAWGFHYKSCLLWIKDDIGMGNYWRVSHEFLLLGVRGKLTFRDRSRPSWIQQPRTTHSRKPSKIRLLIERVSPGPYLEMYGRDEIHDPDWTVYGNQIERRLF